MSLVEEKRLAGYEDVSQTLFKAQTSINKLSKQIGLNSFMEDVLSIFQNQLIYAFC